MHHMLWAHIIKKAQLDRMRQDISIFSFHPVKMITTGEGGHFYFHLKMSLTADSLRSQGYGYSIKNRIKKSQCGITSNNTLKQFSDV